MKTGSLRKVLIANRGEIARRILRTCRGMGIAAVAVYSDADARALHVSEADEAVNIGPAAVGESYLRGDKLIAAARRTGAEAIHPGYGFLSENADFAAACAAAGVGFIGPSPDVMRRMGVKTEGRRIAVATGVPVVPGYDDADQRDDTLRRAALDMGLPVLIKAAAGGGGKGMRVVREAGELNEALESARREAEKAFGDGALLLEKFIARARHVEFQIFGDAHGNVIHLGERDCSVQRRHQKIIEETPSPALTADLRERMGAAAVKLGRALGYVNAGTVEFILAPSGEFYFIEVNTRLQVEHPVTEMTTGLDLVRLQIEMAEGRPLPFTQSDVHFSGCAMEARLYAEDPAHDFLPATGTICDWYTGALPAGVRIDAGVDAGTIIGIHYDPLLAKIIAHGENRESARRKLTAALRGLVVQGVTTNRDFLIHVLEHAAFRAGEADTGFVAAHTAALLAREPEHDWEAAIIVALYIHCLQQAAQPRLKHLPPNYRNNPFRTPSVKLEVAGVECEVYYRATDKHTFAVTCRDREASAQVISWEPGLIRTAIDGLQRAYRVCGAGAVYDVQATAFARAVRRLPRFPERHASSEQQSASAPMPGVVLKVLVQPGQAVLAGEALLVLEAMKMEQTVRAATDGRVEAIKVNVGEVVSPGDVLVQIAPADERKADGS